MQLTQKNQWVVKKSRQKGVVLLVALMMLVAMTLSAIALMRSVDTTNMVAGNLAFQQSAGNVADRGTEQAIAFLYNSVSGTFVNFPNGTTGAFVVNCDGTGSGVACPVGYASRYQSNLDPPTAASWDAFWVSMTANPGVVSMTGLPNGYSGAFVIQALCQQATQINCATTTSASNFTQPQGQDMGAENRSFTSSTLGISSIYYRITTRVEGPRNSVVYTQAFVAW